MKVLDIDGLNYYDGKIKQTYATKTELNAKAPLASPALTGNPTAPTQAKTNNSTRLATTAFVKNNLNDYATLNGATFTGAVNGVTPTAGDNSTKLATTAYVQEELRQHANMPIGHEYFTMNPNVPQGSLPLFGGEYSRSTYADLWAWVQTQTGYLKTEADWQDLATANNGNVPFYSSGDGSTTFRVPSLKCWVKGANGTVTEVGSYLEAGLPNITGSINGATLLSNTEQTGSFGWYSNDPTNYAMVYQDGSMRYGEITFDASNSNSIYGNSSTVQPESIVGMWLVKAYGTIEDTGTIDEQQYIDDRIAALPTSLATTFLPLAGGTMTGTIVGNPLTLTADDGNDSANLVLNPSGSATWNGKEVEIVNSKHFSINSGYIRFESGLQMCWGYNVTESNRIGIVNFPVPFLTIPRIVGSTMGDTGADLTFLVRSDGATVFTFLVNHGTDSMPSVAANWVAVGYWK